MMYLHGHEMGLWGYVSMTILTLVFWLLVIASLAALVKYLTDHQHTQRYQPQRGMSFESVSPADVLATRFARGEISESEYRDRLAVLRELGGDERVGRVPQDHTGAAPGE